MNWFDVLIRCRPATLPEPEAVAKDRRVLPSRFGPIGGADLPNLSSYGMGGLEG